MEQEKRDFITIQDKDGFEKEYAVEALFDMEDHSYALLQNIDETILMRIETEGEEQYLIGINDPDERNSVLDAYQIAVDAAPADELH
ncbi:DUF1292 domain-containing protein [Bacillus sp. AK128]